MITTVDTVPSAPRTARTAPRILDVDALRGFALFGILMVNIGYFASDPSSAGFWLDSAVHSVLAMFFVMKFYLLFAFLFGYTFTLLLDSARRGDAAFRPRFLRRLAGLFTFGLLHAVLLFHGDILMTYAVLGLVLLAVHRITPPTALATAVLLVAVVALAFAMMAIAGVPPLDESAVVTAGHQRYATFGQMVLGTLTVQGPVALAMFLVGLAAGRLRLLASVPRVVWACQLVQWVGYPFGVAGAVIVIAAGGLSTPLGLAVNVLTGPVLAAAYAGTMLQVFHSRWGHQVAAALAPAGRMALSNYLGQSLICTLVFTGLGAAGDVPAVGVVAIATAIFAWQLAFSARWLSTHRHGPAEWLLRAVTNAEVPSWRTRARPTLAARSPQEAAESA